MRDWRGDLLWAIEELDVDRVATLATGHDLNFVGDHGHTPVMAAIDTAAQRAVQRGLAWDITVVELLLSLGASPTLKGHDDSDATDLARRYHWHEAIDAMHAADPGGVPSLFWPLGYVNTSRRRRPHGEDTPWRAELMDAIKRSHVNRVRRLLADQQGTLDFVHPGSSLTPLQLAIEEQGSADRHPTRDATIVRLLLAAGAAPDFPDDPWSSPRARAAQWPEVAALLGP